MLCSPHTHTPPFSYQRFIDISHSSPAVMLQLQSIHTDAHLPHIHNFMICFKVTSGDGTDALKMQVIFIGLYCMQQKLCIIRKSYLRFIYDPGQNLEQITIYLFQRIFFLDLAPPVSFKGKYQTG